MNNRQFELLDVLIMSPESVIFSGVAKAISCKNVKGIIDVLPGHSNFMSLIDKEIVVYHSNGSMQKLNTEKAIIKVVNNQIVILTNVEI
jgi:F0F1-type ATP synthase epsilon subunit